MANCFNAPVLGLGLAAATLLAPVLSAEGQSGEPSISVQVNFADLGMTVAYERCRAGGVNQAARWTNAPIGVVSLTAADLGHRGGLE